MFRSANQGGSAPDVSLANAPNVVTYVNLGLVEPVTDMFTPEDLEDFFPTPRLVRINKNGQALNYDRQITDRLGIKPPTRLDEAGAWDDALAIFKEVQAAERSRRANEQFWALFPNKGNTGLFFSGIFPRSAGEVGSNAYKMNTYKMVSNDGRSVNRYLNDPQAFQGHAVAAGHPSRPRHRADHTLVRPGEALQFDWS